VAIRAAAVAAVAAGGLVIWTYLLEPAAGLIAVVAMLAGWFYSAPPLRLESTGAGEAVASVVVAVLVPVLAVVIQGTSVPAALWWMAWGLAGLQFAAMLAFALPDVDSDRRAGKLTLAVRLGRARSPLFQGAAVVVSLGALATGAALRVLPAPFLLLGVPALISGLIQVITARSDRFTLITMSAAATLLLAISAAIGSFLIGTEV
jgi:1,4-dihydroxy-2-naphthoate octaprenyltransferase